MKINILGVNFDVLDLNTVMNRVAVALKNNTRCFIVTPNPEFVVLAQKDIEFRKILNSADISLADGTGIILAAYILKKRLPNRITGNDMILALSKFASEHFYPIFLFGGEKGVAHQAGKKLKGMFPQLSIAGTLDGRIISDPKHIPEDITTAINQSGARILFVALGQGKQERFIAYAMKKLPNINVAIGVGGAFDFLSGKIKRAPLWMRRFGLEWLFRLIQEPKRWRRIIRATIIFPMLVFRQKIHHFLF